MGLGVGGWGLGLGLGLGLWLLIGYRSSWRQRMVIWWAARLVSACGAQHGTRLVRHARGWYAYGARAVVPPRGSLPRWRGCGRYGVITR